MVNPFPTGSFTLQDAPSFTWHSNAAVDGPGSQIIDARIIFSGNPACLTHLFTGSAADGEQECFTGLPSTAAFIGGSAIAEQPMNALVSRRWQILGEL